MSWFSVKWKIGAVSLTTRSSGIGEGLSFSFSVLASEFEFAISLEENLEVAAGESIGRGNITDGRVQPHGVVMVNEALDKSSAILLGKRTAWPETIDFEGLVPSLDFPVALRVVRGGFDMGQTGQADKLLEVLGNKLRPVVGNDPRGSTRISFSSSLHDDLDVKLRHRGAQFPMQQEARTAIQ